MRILWRITFLCLCCVFFLGSCKGPLGPNSAPVANAGTDVSTSENLTAVILDGGDSTDADGSDLTYSWSVVSTVGVSSASLSDSSSVSPTLNMTGFDATGDSVSVQLIVNDGRDDSLANVVLISHT